MGLKKILFLLLFFLTIGTATATTNVSFGFFPSNTNPDTYTPQWSALTHVANVVNDAVSRRLLLQGKNPDSVEVVFDELSTPELTPEFMLEMANTGKITDDELREWVGFQPKQEGIL